jgi:hypothetical protein
MFRVSRLGNAWMYENDCLHSLKAMLLGAKKKKDARLKPAATFAGAGIGA